MLGLPNSSALAWTLRRWLGEYWPLFVMMNFTYSRTLKGAALSKNAFGRSSPRSTGRLRPRSPSLCDRLVWRQRALAEVDETWLGRRRGTTARVVAGHKAGRCQN